MNWILLSIFLSTLAVSYIITALVRTVAPSLGMVDHPDSSRKLHKEPTPLLGGVAIFLSFISMLLIANCCVPEIFESANKVHWLLVLFSGAMVCLLGVVDDKVALQPKTKLFGQILSCLPMVFGGGIVSQIGFLGLSFELGSFAVPFTMLWLITCINVINLLDGLDGLAASVCIISASSIAAIASLSGQFEISVVSLILISAILGFLIHNWPPARIFMGDAGSMMIGFMIGALALDASLKKTTALSLVVPIGLIGIPLLDTVMAMFRRSLTGKSVGEADRRHLHHRLIDAGLSKTKVLLGICLLCVGINGLAVITSYTQLDAAAVVGGLALLCFLVGYDIFGRYEFNLIFKAVKAKLSSSRLIKTNLPVNFFQSSPEASIEDWRMSWDIICDSIKSDTRSKIEIQCISRKTNALEFSDTFPENSSDFKHNENFWHSKYSIKIDDEHVVTVSATGTIEPANASGEVKNIWPQLVNLCRTFPIEILKVGQDRQPEIVILSETTGTKSYIPRSAA